MTDLITIAYVVCTPYNNGISNFYNQIYDLTTPVTVFSASTYFSTVSNCTLSYNIYNSQGTDVTYLTSPFQFSSGLFKITSYSNYIFD